MIIDGADQAKYRLPRLATQTHQSQGAFKTQIHLMGVIVHGRQNYVYTHLDNSKAGNNVTIDVMHRTLVDQAKRGPLPRTCFLQLDNTTRQCKGQFLYAYLASLVDHGVFDKIILSFLPVGHTHEDIDQFFSRLAVALRHRNIWSRVGLTEAILETFPDERHRPKVEHLDSITNFRDWIKDHYRKTLFAGLTEFHQIKFYPDPETGATSFSARNWCGGSDPWHGFAEVHVSQTNI
jgi:hypothetical protein